MEGVPVHTVVRLLDQAKKEHDGKDIFVSEMQPGLYMNMFDGPGGELLGKIDFKAEKIVWLDEQTGSETP